MTNQSQHPFRYPYLPTDADIQQFNLPTLDLSKPVRKQQVYRWDWKYGFVMRDTWYYKCTVCKTENAFDRKPSPLIISCPTCDTRRHL